MLRGLTWEFLVPKAPSLGYFGLHAPRRSLPLELLLEMKGRILDGESMTENLSTGTFPLKLSTVTFGSYLQMWKSWWFRLFGGFQRHELVPVWKGCWSWIMEKLATKFKELLPWCGEASSPVSVLIFLKAGDHGRHDKALWLWLDSLFVISSDIIHTVSDPLMWTCFSRKAFCASLEFPDFSPRKSGKGGMQKYQYH